MAPPPKRRRIVAPLKSQPQELTFDPSARQEYLSGFSKRKAARKEAAREQAIKREKEERVRERAQLREQRKEDLKMHVEAVDAVLAQQREILGEEDEEWEGVTTEAVGGVENEEEEYTDEEKYTTVTVEAMDSQADVEEDELEAEGRAKKAAAEEAAKEAERVAKAKKLRPWEKPRWDGKEKKKKPKFRYESKAERAVGRMKQKSKNSAAAKARRGKE